MLNSHIIVYSFLHIYLTESGINSSLLFWAFCDLLNQCLCSKVFALSSIVPSDVNSNFLAKIKSYIDQKNQILLKRNCIFCIDIFPMFLVHVYKHSKVNFFNVIMHGFTKLTVFLFLFICANVVMLHYNIFGFT